MNIASQTLARQRVRQLRKRQIAFNLKLDLVIDQLSAPGSPATDPTPGRWCELWTAWQAADASLLAIANELAPRARKRGE